MWNAKEDLRAPITVYHELGHLFDARENYGGDFRKYCRANIIEVELKAWIYGAYLAKALGFAHWDAFLEFMRVCLGSYLQAKKHPTITLDGAIEQVANIVNEGALA